MRIGYLIPHFPSQTAVLFWREIKAIERLGVQVDIISTRRADQREICHEWANEAIGRTRFLYPLTVHAILEAVSLLVLAGPSSWWRCLRAITQAEAVGIGGRARMIPLTLIGAAVAAHARRRRCQHLHVHSCADSLMIGAFAHLLTGMPYSMTLHGPLEHYGGAQNVKWRYAKFAITVTERLRREVLEAVPTARPEHIHVAPMGVDLQRFERSKPYEPARCGHAVRIVTCGRLHLNKGHQELIRAVASLRDERIDSSLTILGEGPARPMLEDLINTLGLHDAVTLAGAVDEDGVRSQLERAHIFALGSYDEAIGVATMEAMAMGLPVAVTDVGGVHELVRDGVDGCMVSPRNSAAIAETVRRFVEDPEAARRMGESGRIRVRERFNSERSAAVIGCKFAHAKRSA